MSTCSDNTLGKEYLDNKSIITSKVEAITTISYTRSSSLEEVDDILINNLIEETEIMLNEVIVRSIHDGGTWVVV